MSILENTHNDDPEVLFSALVILELFDPSIKRAISLTNHDLSSGFLPSSTGDDESSSNAKRGLKRRRNRDRAESSDEDEPSDEPSPRKKGRAGIPRKRASAEQVVILEGYFAVNQFPKGDLIEAIAHETKMTTSKVKNWFQNKRAKERRVRKRRGLPEPTASNNKSLNKSASSTTKQPGKQPLLTTPNAPPNDPTSNAPPSMVFPLPRAPYLTTGPRPSSRPHASPSAIISGVPRVVVHPQTPPPSSSAAVGSPARAVALSTPGGGPPSTAPVLLPTSLAARASPPIPGVKSIAAMGSADNANNLPAIRSVA